MSHTPLESDQETWTCVGFNPVGSHQQDIKLHVIEKTSILGEAGAVHAYLGKKLILQCKYKVDKRLISAVGITWTKNGLLLPDHDGEDELVLETVRSDDDAGVYGCNVITDMDSASKTWTVSVVQAPIIEPFPHVLKMLEGSNVSVRCKAQGFPSPRTRWKSTGKDILTFNPVASALNGSRDVCMAENEHGESERATILLVAKASTLKVTNQTRSTVQAGSRVVLECSVEVDPQLLDTVTYQWARDDDTLAVDSFVGDGSKTLEIAYVRREHQGSYSCRVITELDSVVLVQDLRVLWAAPIFKTFAEESANLIEGMAGDSVEKLLRCEAGGIPPPKVTFKVSGDKSNLRMRVEGVETSDQNTLSCLAVNEYGRAHLEFKAHVYQPMKSEFSGPRAIVKSSLENVVLPCGLKIDPRLHERTAVTWLKDDQQVVVRDGDVRINETDHSMEFEEVLKNDEGYYTCMAVNEFESANQTTNLTVLGYEPSFIATEKDVVALEGFNVTISCQANGIPMPKISWKREGGEQIDLSDSSQVLQRTLGDLVIFSVSLEDEGMYICEAANIYGTIQSLSRVEVMRKAAKTNTEGMKEIVKNIKENVSLTCDVSYDPRLHEDVTVSWSKYEKPIQSDSQHFVVHPDWTLEIRNLIQDDRGLYECHVKTPFETIVYKVALQVSGEAPNIQNELGKVTLYEGEQLKLDCLVRGVPRPSLEWLYNGQAYRGTVQEVPTATDKFRESFIKITEVSKAHEGLYQCEAANAYGSGVAKFARVVVIKRTSVHIVPKGGPKVRTLSEVPRVPSLTN